MKIRPYVRGEKLAFGECITQGGVVCDSAELSRLANRAKELASGLNLVTSEGRSFYGEDHEVHVPDWYGIAILIDRVENP